MFKNKTLLITGGTGTFGNAVLKRFLETDIGEIRVFSRDEKKQDDMRNVYAHPKLKFYIGDVRDASSLRDAMAGVDFVFHAAALKQVPSCEFFPLEALRTNALGTENGSPAIIQRRQVLLHIMAHECYNNDGGGGGERQSMMPVTGNRGRPVYLTSSPSFKYRYRQL
ncbi:MAG: polysaccharide biosynthesis protein [bacterium]